MVECFVQGSQCIVATSEKGLASEVTESGLVLFPLPLFLYLHSSVLGSANIVSFLLLHLVRNLVLVEVAKGPDLVVPSETLSI